ncbi:hypothetical protein BDR22DRAFT_234585 [Usnea florida]
MDQDSMTRDFILSNLLIFHYILPLPADKVPNPLYPWTVPSPQAQKLHHDACFCQQKTDPFSIQLHPPSTNVVKPERSCPFPHSPNPIQASPLAITVLAANGCADVGAIVGWMAAALAGAGGGEVFEDESVRHCCGSEEPCPFIYSVVELVRLPSPE